MEPSRPAGLRVPFPREKDGNMVVIGWIIVGLSFLTIAFHLTARFSFAIFQVPLITEFGWTRGALGGVFALMMGLYALFSPFSGSLLDKFGPRAVVPWGSVLVGIGLVGGFFISSLFNVFFSLFLSKDFKYSLSFCLPSFLNCSFKDSSLSFSGFSPNEAISSSIFSMLSINFLSSTSFVFSLFCKPSKLLIFAPI